MIFRPHVGLYSALASPAQKKPRLRLCLNAAGAFKVWDKGHPLWGQCTHLSLGLVTARLRLMVRCYR